MAVFVPNCRVCHQPLAGRAREVGLCGKPACTRTDAAAGRRCAVCGIKFPFHDRQSEVCTAPDCRRELLWRQARQAVRWQKDDLRRRVAELRDSARPADDAARYPLAIIPSYRVAITPLPDERRHRFRVNLQQLIARAREQPAAPPGGEFDPGEPGPAPELSASLSAIVGQACTLCQGYCCRKGEEHAHLRVDTLRRYLRAHPEQNDDEIVAAYESHLGAETYGDSCVFHGPGGCTMPRAIRSQVCNNFLCEGLLEYLADQPPDQQPRAFIACTSSQMIGASGFADERGIAVVRMEEPGQ